MIAQPDARGMPVAGEVRDGGGDGRPPSRPGRRGPVRARLSRPARTWELSTEAPDLPRMRGLQRLTWTYVSAYD